ncbi:LITAF-like zinc ribbon domain protein (macronuclear) [Tetrahymena thermophila SB210]|uniref:LITAF-like zinc ribbon domain protein n=1 Tax=Tetrahymena thermophila (strain SB210) TaxID=312017 RepID=Q22RY8_TETTS|nr:LITAF-like zinc ribbon domain protein [Tetrahymena thermophila SB210]EAR87984.1 LITAF-like zinc ribbon domain protein [Tetrahymena thermophila SB210]|eukprot:XP_001008229.1 LITAF-like zinc ribbon domain protein [Tetrahymena thermophila SB210]
MYPQVQNGNPQAQNNDPHNQNALPPVTYPPMQNQPLQIQSISLQQNPQVQQDMADKTPYPFQTTCHHCKKTSTTKVTSKAGYGTWTMCSIFCVLTGCGCIPFFINNCKDKIHTCPNCQTQLGVFRYKVF